MLIGSEIVTGEPIKIGPESVDYRLIEKSRVFGGDQLIATDIAVASGLIDLGNRRALDGQDADMGLASTQTIHHMIDEGVDHMKADSAAFPLITVGVGAFLVPDDVAGISEVVRVPHAEVANAVGAAIAQVSGEIDQVFSGLTRDEAIAEAVRLAENRSVEAGQIGIP